MLKSRPDMPTHLILAIEHHRQLLEDAQRARNEMAARKVVQVGAVRWFGVRTHVGNLLINLGQRLKGTPQNAANTVWG